MSRPSDSSSSEDESHFQHNFNVPAVNLASLRKNNKKQNAKTNLVKAKKKITGNANRNVKYSGEDVPHNRNTMVSTSSHNNVDSSSSDSDSVSMSSLARAREEEGAKDLPNFAFRMPEQRGGNDDDDDDESDDNDETAMPLEIEDSSDEEDDEEEVDPKEYRKPPPRGRSSIGSRQSKGSNSTHSRSGSHEVDLADVRRTSSHTSRNSRKSSSIRNIFRRQSLLDQADSADTPSRSDTFIGRVLNMGGGGLSGGGLAPGASRAGEHPGIDEEEEVGGEAEDHAIEMQNLNYAELNEAARDLIDIHAPELKESKRMNRVAFDTPEEKNEFTDVDLQEGSSLDHEQEEKAKEPERSSSHKRQATIDSADNPFYQPNPDLLRDNLDDDLQDDDLLLAEGGGDDYVAPPKQVHAGVLSSLLKLYQNQGASKSTASFNSSTNTMLADEQFDDSEYNSKNVSQHDFTQLKNNIKSGPKRLANKFKKKTEKPGNGSDDEDFDEDAAKLPSFQNARPKAPKQSSSNRLGKKLKKNKDQKLRITVHIADILQRQRFIIRICRALMLYGAPTHRLEEYMVMTSRVLEIDGQFVYFPGTMLIAFGDAATRTSEVHLVRCAQGLNLSKLSDTHKIYKDVIHDLTSVEEATRKLEELLRRKNQYPPWVSVFLYALGSCSVCTFGFGGGWLDVPISFGLGAIVGYLQFFVSSKSHLYSSVFEVTSSIVVSFVARGIGSANGGDTFCFGAIAQGSLALILPGYIILCGSLELQSKNIVAGSVRMFYAIIYSLFLGFGITLGAALYGWVDSNATDQAQCTANHELRHEWRILFVPLFTTCLGLINQARFRQLPVMLFISCTAYVGTYFAGKHFQNVTEFTAAIGSFIIGILGNMYSRVGRGMAVSAMLPAIFVQVPSGIASKSTLLAGVDTANRITNATKGAIGDGETTSSSLSFGATMVEVSIGISVGLFAAALVVYPFGKRRTSLFTL
ncbi:hypothetical protein FT663_02952 [Candidozyma haemuli var. vulneris]|uniref:Pheromone-regulated membrane protein 10 n=1 Tax=Candidozyma haemuli TaxID=45357 RepID=A0A2V1AWT1_9ASCO|nr:hypothetical protein CXQ85_005346 [[Candida] haemuloni]KAF3985906.1 hypothetical protein FT662_04865 [[Candida] haemuloni var. vulneris]KAF3990986.1 hypothetical protein FT663_02952 [[Candida] haemuloni var. vulneris]PVH22318.1 hypothetical protein CXQ85_005346 [[Candida] haemuloni]